MNALLATIFAIATLGATGRYTMKDLEILEEQKGHQEFFAHAKDIPPGKRDKHWQNMVRSMAVGLMDFKLKRKDFREHSLSSIESLASWPILRNDTFFQAKRGHYTLEYFKQCADKSVCRKRIERYLLSSPLDVQTTYNLAKEMARQDPKANLWPHLAKIAKQKDASPWCGQDFFSKQALRELSRQVALEERPKFIARAIDNTFHPDCWRELAPVFGKALLQKSTPPDPLEDMLFRLLSAKKALSGDEEDLYLSLFILKGPVVGQTFNMAWNRLKKLGQDWRRRQKVVQKLIRRHPLPDGFIATGNIRKRQALLDLLVGHLPEYLEAYAKICLDHLEGRTKSPAGNPAGRCHDFFRHTKGSAVITDRLRMRYSGLKKGGR